MRHREGLNDKQLEAVLATEGPLLIVAGAGAGKTKTITHRIIELVKKGIAPEQILAITFTNKAAREMRERAYGLLSGERVEGVPFISTFHSLGLSILKEHAGKVGRNSHFSIIDEGDSLAMIKEAIKEASLDPKEFEPRRFRGLISREKGNLHSVDDFALAAGAGFESLAVEIWRAYEKKLAESGGFDFDDLLGETVKLLRKNADVRESYQKRWHYIHIDEYQDTNQVQYELVKLLVGPDKNICVVGDTDQNIYSWRGANLKNLLHFERDYANAKVVLLEQNYRSTKTILEAANAIIAKNTMRIDKNLFTENGEGEKIMLVECYDERNEADFVATTALELRDRKNVPLDEIAVLYRANFQSRIFEEALLDYHIPYQVVGTRFFERREVKDMLSYLRAARNRESLHDVKRIINVPPRGIGKVTFAKMCAGTVNELPEKMQKKIENFYDALTEINEYGKTHTPAETIFFVLERTGLKESLEAGGEDDLERLENIQELVTLSLKYSGLPGDEGIEKLLDDAVLVSDQDTIENGAGGVRLMTVHAAKGLEFRHVFIVGLEQDLFPHARRAGEKVEDSEEERRLFYVALTRAREKLYLCYASLRTIFGMRQVEIPSEFLYDIPARLTERESVHSTRTHEKVIYFD